MPARWSVLQRPRRWRKRVQLARAGLGPIKILRHSIAQKRRPLLGRPRSVPAPPAQLVCCSRATVQDGCLAMGPERRNAWTGHSQ